MKRFLGWVGAVCLLFAAVAFSGGQRSATPELQIASEERNPWTSLRLNNDPAEFQFAIVSDRTGGHRARVFSEAVEQLNLLQPQFVLSVGDLIEGYKQDKTKLAAEWREFQTYLCKLQMPFFYVPGNHDLSNLVTEKMWQEKFGRRHYHFVYRDVLFLILNSDDPANSGHIGEEQIKDVQKVLADNTSVRWTIVALHRPLWAERDLEKNGWLEVEKALSGRPYTVFAGHIHTYRKFVRNGQRYYQLATTGGVSKMRGVRYGEFDHIVWVTMKKDGPLLANLLLDGIYNDAMKQPVTDETGVIEANRRPLQPVHGKVLFEGCTTPNAMVTFYLANATDKRLLRVADALVEADGTFTLSTYTAQDGAPEGEYAVTVVWRNPLVDEQGKPGPNLLPARYASPATSELRVQVKEGANEFTLELRK